MSSDSKQWYVVHAYSGYEKFVQDALKDRVENSEYADKFGDILVPTEDVVEMRSGKKRKSERKFFPGYVLVHMEMNENTWHLVKSVPRVLGFIGGTSDQPAPITEKEARSIAIQDGYKTAAKVPLETARTCEEILDLAIVIAEKGNKNSISDAAVSALMAKAGMQSAILNVKINLGSIKDEQFVKKISSNLDNLERNADTKTIEILKIVNGNL